MKRTIWVAILVLTCLSCQKRPEPIKVALSQPEDPLQRLHGMQSDRLTPESEMLRQKLAK